MTEPPCPNGRECVFVSYGVTLSLAIVAIQISRQGCRRRKENSGG